MTAKTRALQVVERVSSAARLRRDVIGALTRRRKVNAGDDAELRDLAERVARENKSGQPPPVAIVAASVGASSLTIEALSILRSRISRNVSVAKAPFA